MQKSIKTVSFIILIFYLLAVPLPPPSSGAFAYVLALGFDDMKYPLQAMHIAAVVEANTRLLPKLHGLYEALVEKVLMGLIF